MPCSSDSRPDELIEPIGSDPCSAVVIVAHASGGLREYLCEHLANVCDIATCVESDPLPVVGLEQRPGILLIDAELPRLERERLTRQLRIAQGTVTPVVWIKERTGDGTDAGDVQRTQPDAYIARTLPGDELRRTVRTFLELAQLRHEKALQATKRDHVIDNFSESFIAVDANWRVTHINAAAEHYLHTRRDDVLGKDAWAVFAVDPSRAEVYRRVMEERVAAKFDGLSLEHGWFHLDAIPFDDGGLGVYFRNADRLKVAEAAAFASERRLRIFLEGARDYALVLLDAQAQVIEWLGGATDITGWSSEEMVGEKLEAMFAPEDVASGEMDNQFQQASEFGRAADSRWHLKKDGSRFFADGVTTAFRDEKGKLQGFGKIFRDTTAQKLAEQALRESQEKLQLILSSVADGIYSITQEGLCELANPAAAVMLGYEPEELENRPIHESVHHHRLDGTVYPVEQCRINRAIRDRLAVRVDDEVFWHKDGTPIPVHYSVNPMKSRGEITGAVVSFTDITARKRAEAALAESDRRLRFVMDSIPQKIFTATREGKVDYLNPAWENFSGRKPSQLRENNWAEFIHPEDIEVSWRVWHRCVERGEPFEVEHRFRDAHGEYLWHLSRARPMRDDAGRVVMWVGSNTDIHHIKTAEFELTQDLASERRSVAILSEVAAASHNINSVLSVDSIARILTEEARAILGVGRAIVSMVRGGDYISIVLDDSGHHTHQVPLMTSGLCAEVCRTGKPLRLTQAELERHEGSQAALEDGYGHRLLNGWLAVPLMGHGSKNIGLVQASDKCEGEFTAEDQAILTQLASIAAVGIENAALYSSLREQDQRKDEFLATLAHELRNPLAPLRSGLDILQLSDVGERLSQVGAMMDRQLSHLVRLVDDLMDVSRVSRGKVELKRTPVRLKDVVEIALEATTPLINAEEQQLRVLSPDTALYINGDPTRLAQVLSNLLNNAAKYTPRGGKIELLIERREGQAIIRVTDTGIGLSPEMLPKVFHLFTQVGVGNGQPNGGLGIGLSLVHQLVEMHGGTVVAESPGLGRGSTFTVTLPLIRAAEVPGTPLKPEASAGVGRKRLLVVDDNRDAADALAIWLELAGHEVIVAYTGEKGICVALKMLPDLIFLDLGLPGMSGYEVAGTLRQEVALKETILVALTGWGSDEDRRRSRAAGFDLHLTKPVNAKVITGALGRFFPASSPP